MRVILGLHWDNGNENGGYYIIGFRGLEHGSQWSSKIDPNNHGGRRQTQSSHGGVSPNPAYRIVNQDPGVKIPTCLQRVPPFE